MFTRFVKSPITSILFVMRQSGVKLLSDNNYQVLTKLPPSYDPDASSTPPHPTTPPTTVTLHITNGSLYSYSLLGKLRWTWNIYMCCNIRHLVNNAQRNATYTFVCGAMYDIHSELSTNVCLNFLRHVETVLRGLTNAYLVLHTCNVHQCWLLTCCPIDK